VKKILVIGKKSNTTKIIVNSLLLNDFNVCFVQEKRNDSLSLIFRRIKKLGLFTVFLQLIFQIYHFFLGSISKSRVNEIIGNCNAELVSEQLFENVNDIHAIDLISSIDADLILISGTRILSSSFIKKMSLPIINLHVGITPKYRGVHGGYWALINGDTDCFGSTIHFVDEGIDTGLVVKYVYTKPSIKDNFHTYPLLQQKSAICELIEILNNKELQPQISTLVSPILSKLWSHPTIIEYFWYRYTKGIC
jgi:hypothetical protein